ncbi:Filament-like plant protein 5 [Cardamine amara subsp. amara]|uniref:Filament-like plant protein 5 n=1 Tax=Cardamine amara subsp. amara TaxID=228776 RepID=A0ABD1B9G1_CARAN
MEDFESLDKSNPSNCQGVFHAPACRVLLSPRIPYLKKKNKLRLLVKTLKICGASKLKKVHKSSIAASFFSGTNTLLPLSSSFLLCSSHECYLRSSRLLNSVESFVSSIYHLEKGAKMDGRSWLWKRKSSDKATTEKPVVGNESTPVCSLSYLASLENQEKCKNTNYVQITMDSYTHMSRMEDQVKLFESEVKDLKDKLTIAHSEIKTKESSILQHAKVAEEAVSGWEKADAETLALKRQLESVTLLKLTAEDRASHLDDALKECTRQIRIVKDESEQKLQDMILAKTMHWDKIKSELEGKIDELSQGLHRAASDNAALTRSLQERSEMIIRISEERSKAEANVEKLKTNIHLAEKEISSLKYDVHVASKEVEIRNEDKNMSLKSAEIANKQHLEGVKKIAKLEAECQRLRGLLRKKLPGPAAMTQMKIEVDSLGQEFTDPRAQRSIANAKPEVSADHKLEECKRENVTLTRRALEMEEEIQTLKELLASRNNELQVSRNVCGKTLGKLKILEGQMHKFNKDKNASKSSSRNLSESPSSGNEQNYSSVTSVSEDGFDEEGSSSECGPATSNDSVKVRKVSVVDGSSKPKISNRLELMDDFLEIEKLAANDTTDGANSASKSSNSVFSSKSVDKQSATKSNEQDEDTITTLDQLFMVLCSRINRIFESQEGISIEKIVEAARLSIQELQGSSPKKLSIPLFQVADETLEKHVLSSQETKKSENVQKNTKKQDLEAAVSNIHHFIKSTTKEATQLQEVNGNGRLSDSLEDFSSLVSKYSTGESSLSELILELSRISVLASNLNNVSLSLKPHSKETSIAVSNEKVTLLEKEVEESDSDPLGDTFSKTDDDDSSSKSLLKELEQLKLEKENIALELSRCLQNLESTKAGLEEKEKLISKLKSQLSSSNDLQSLAETQLKCVTESYKSLELRAKDLEAKVKSLEEETERLEMAFSAENHGHEVTLAKCRDLQETLQRQRNETCRKCSSSKLQPNQEKDIASATEKLAACQETIHLLSQQLQSLQPQSKSQSLEKKLQHQETSEATLNSSLDDLPHDHIIQQSRSVRHTVNPTVHAIIKSNSVSSSSKEDNEKHTRGLGRFFSSKTKSHGR